MNTKDIIDKLSSMGIVTVNCYPKTSFPSKKTNSICIGLFKREMAEDFYFYNTFDKKIYLFKKPESIENYQKDEFNSNVKFLVPLEECTVIWEDKEYTELVDENFSTMTLRTYACIHLGIPETNIEWLNILIKKGNDNKGTKTVGGS